MNKQMKITEFAEQVLKLVKNALPQELAEAEVCVTCLNTDNNAVCMLLLVNRPWNSTATGFSLDNWYKHYSDGSETIESVSAAIINDRTLYHVSGR